MTRCYDNCGAETVDEAAAEHAGWSYLASLKVYRCGACAGALWRAAALRGTDAPAEFVDPLPPGSRGALPKATAESIAAPVVNPNPGV